MVSAESLKLRSNVPATHDLFLPGDDYIKRWGYTVDKNGTVPYTP